MTTEATHDGSDQGDVPDLVSERLILRPLTVQEARAVLRGERAGKRWAAGYPTEGDLEVAEMLVTHPPSDRRAVLFGIRQIVLRETGDAIGGIGFFGPPDAEGTVSIGYGIAEEYRRRGLTTEALLTMVDMARADPAVRRVSADTTHDNLASQRVMEKAGLTRTRSDDELVYYAIELR